MNRQVLKNAGTSCVYYPLPTTHHSPVALARFRELCNMILCLIHTGDRRLQSLFHSRRLWSGRLSRRTRIGNEDHETSRAVASAHFAASAAQRLVATPVSPFTSSI